MKMYRNIGTKNCNNMFTVSMCKQYIYITGVNIYDDKTYCLVDHLEYIMLHYGHHHYSYMDETGKIYV